MPRITEMFVYASDAGPDDEGVIGATTALGFMPLVGADLTRAYSLIGTAQAVAQVTGKEVRLLRFAGPPEILEVLSPEPATDA